MIANPWTFRLVSVPTLVMLGWDETVTDAAVLTVPLIFWGFRFVMLYPSPEICPETSRLTRVPKLVMLDWVFPETVRATVEFATFPVTFEPLMFEIPEPFEATKRPCTFRPVRVPTLVMLGWEAPVTLKAKLALATLPTKFDEFRFEIPEPLEATKRPWMFRPVSVPTLVMLGWEAPETTRATFEFATLPTRLDEFRFEIADPLEMVTCPWTTRLVRTPTLVMLGWAAPVTVKARLALETFPVTLDPLILESPEAFPKIFEA